MQLFVIIISSNRSSKDTVNIIIVVAVIILIKIIIGILSVSSLILLLLLLIIFIIHIYRILPQNKWCFGRDSPSPSYPRCVVARNINSDYFRILCFTQVPLKVAFFFYLLFMCLHGLRDTNQWRGAPSHNYPLFYCLVSVCLGFVSWRGWAQGSI